MCTLTKKPPRSHACVRQSKHRSASRYAVDVQSRVRGQCEGVRVNGARGALETCCRIMGHAQLEKT
eukprot:4625861-Pleurochrysis_carterae.AAC.1